jgi:hypothetical protein
MDAKPQKVYLISEWAGHCGLTNDEACGDQPTAAQATTNTRPISWAITS